MEVVIDVAVSILTGFLTGFALWAVLPRGVVLTRRGYEGSQNVWELRNDSALPVQITSATVMGAITYNEETGKIEEIELPPEYLPGDKYFGLFSLAFVDPVTEIRRADELCPWLGQVVPPGDGLRALVVPQGGMLIKYRRDGRLGIFERREIGMVTRPDAAVGWPWVSAAIGSPKAPN